MTQGTTLRSSALLLSMAAISVPGWSQVVISQVYGGGGNANAPLTNDYVELLNRGADPVSLSGWSIQYTSAAGTGNFGQNATLITELPPVMLLPGQYFLVKEAGGTTGSPFTADHDDPTPINMSATAGKVALVRSAASLGCNGSSTPCGPAALALIEDLVGYGNANFFEGSGAAPTGSNTTSITRLGGGCQDSRNNAADFATAPPLIRTTASPLNPCSGPLTITTGSPLPDGTFGTPYGPVTFAATGGSGTGYILAQVSGTIPDGLKLAGAVLSGTPTALGSFGFRMRVTDSLGAIAEKDFALTVGAPTCTPTTTISAIQGSGSLSPLVPGPNMQSAPVTVEAVVVGVKLAGTSSGFFIQEMGGGDGNPLTSDGLFVFTGSAIPSAVIVGNRVCVRGPVREFAPSSAPGGPHITEIDQPNTTTLLQTGQALPAPVILVGDGSGLDKFERFEGMRVTAASLNVVAPTGGSVNETNATSTTNGLFFTVFSGVARPFREPGVELPNPLPAGSPCCVPRFDANPERLAVDSNAQAGSTALNLGTGSVIMGARGVLDFSSRAYTLLLESRPDVVSDNLLSYTTVPAAAAGEITVGSANLQRFFDTADDPGVSDTVLTPTAFANRLNKASLAVRLAMNSPDILGVEEVENLAALQALADKINADSAPATPGYQAFLVEGNDVGGIDVGFLVKTSKVTVNSVIQIGKDETYINPINGQPDLLNDRPPLVLRASARREGSAVSLPLVVVVNHLRSLTGIEDAADGPRVRAKRLAQAQYLAGLLQSLQAAGENVVSVGDYNAFQFSDGLVDVLGVARGSSAPANEVVAAGPDLVEPDYINLVSTLSRAPRYSYVFGGNAQILDHILVNAQMNGRLTRFGYVRNNADFPEVLRNDPNRPERFSDHDMPVAAFRLP